MSVVLKAVDEAFGLEGVAVTTFQALSGRGDAKYDPALVVGNVYPLTGTEERTDEYQRSELMRIFPGITRCSVSAHRVPVQTGHFVDVKLQTRKKIVSATAVKDVMRQFNPLSGLNLPSQPKMPIVVVDEPGRPRPLNDADYENGMAVAVGNIRTDDGFFDLTFSVVLNNVARGAWGAALINAEFYHLHVRPIIELKHDKEAQHRHLESVSSCTCCIRETSQMGYHSELSTELDSSDSDKESMDEANRCVL
jgi:aspartate-semialdehyde dehydrogenase